MRQIIEKESKNRELMQNVLLNESIIFKWMVELFGALSYLHSNKMNIIHRNIKPE